MQREQQLRETWEREVLWGKARPVVAITDEGLMLGAGTVLARMGRHADGTSCPDTEADHDRLVALLAVLTRGRVPLGFAEPLAKVSRDWARGEKALAAIRLAFLGLPRVESRDDAYRLHLADQALALGVTPEGLLKELGFSTAVTGLLKRTTVYGSGQPQPRVPAGQSTGGQFASSDGAGGAAAQKPTAKPNVQVALLDDHRVSDGVSPTKEEPDEVMGLEPTHHHGQEPNAITVPMMPFGGIKTGPEPGLTIVPGTGAAPSGDTSSENDIEPERKENECPAAEDDVKHGASPAAKAWQAFVNSIANFLDPTPHDKAYFLPNPAKNNALVSYDDCVKTNLPNGIPGSHKGDMVEAKNKRLDYLLMNNMNGKSDAWTGFLDQVQRQNSAIKGTGRKIFYCFEGDKAPVHVAKEIGRNFTDSVFMQCK